MKKFFVMMAAVVAFGLTACDKNNTETGGPAEAPTADFEYVVNGLEVSFTAKATNAVSYKWAFGDGETAKTADAKHEYAEAGEFDVVLTVANADGVTAKAEKKVKVAGAPKAYFSYTIADGRAGGFGKTVAFDASSSQNATSISWDFGDGETSTEFKPTHTFASFGVHKVSCTVKGDGGEDTYSADVDCVKKTSLIKGGSMNEDDKEFWTVGEYWGYDAGQYVPVEGVYSYAPVFGCTEVEIKGNGPCYKFESNPLGWDFNNKGAIYQAFDVEQGDVIEVDLLAKWGPETQDNGHMSIRCSYDNYAEEDCVLFWLNNFWGVHDPSGEDGDTERYTNWVPAFEGNLAECAEQMADYGCGPEEGAFENGKLRFTAYKTGKCFIIIFVDQVWGFAFGAGRDIYVDEITVDAVVD